MPECFEGQVLTLSSEGQGILRHHNLVVFVPFTAPGDSVQYTIVHQKKNFAQGKLLEVLDPSPHRTMPLCRYYGACGGCQLQHMTYEAQLESKRQIIEDALRRIGKITDVSIPPVIPAKLNWAYRRHITLKIRPEGDTLVAGYIAVDNHSLIPVQHCPIFIPESDPSIQQVQSLLKNLSSNGFAIGSAILFKTESGQMILSLNFEKEIEFDAEIMANFLKQYPQWMGVCIHAGEKKWAWGNCQSIITVNEMRFVCSPNVFTQNHPEQSLKIYQQISQIVASKPKAKVLDLYCGIGITSLLIAKQGRDVIGVEYNKESIELAQENARMNYLSTVRFIQGDVDHVLRQQLKKKIPDIIVVNPPRTGLTPVVIDEILKRRPQEILYVSCMPSTLARDLQQLCSKDYKLSFVQPYDMFPQTNHVETLVHLTRM